MCSVKNRNTSNSSHIYRKQIYLPKYMIHATEKSFFTNLSNAKKEKNVIKKIILFIYKDNK